MDDLRLGALVRAVRHRLGWTQLEVARRARVSQSLVSLLERGHLEALTVRSARRIAATLEIRLPFDPRWRGGDGARLLDSEHALLVNAVVSLLRAAGWEVLVEYTFNHYGERGSVDVMGWHPGRRSLLIVEVKSRLLDIQDTVATLGRKVRVVPGLLAKERDWRVQEVGVGLVVAELTAQPDGHRAPSRHVRRGLPGAGVGHAPMDRRSIGTGVGVLVSAPQQHCDWYAKTRGQEARAHAASTLNAPSTFCATVATLLSRENDLRKCA